MENLINVANGKAIADIVLKNGYVINVFTEETIQTDVAIVGNRIAALGKYEGKQTIDCTGKYIAPGFIDAHMHIESAMVTPLEFSKYALAKGTTTIFADPHELVNVLGQKGLDFMLTSIEETPMTTHIMMPSCVPATDIDNNGAGEILASDMAPYLEGKQVFGLAEMMRFDDVVKADGKILDKLALFKNQIVDGHAPGLTGKALQAYRAAGIDTEHEAENYEEAIEKLRAGFKLLIREGSAARNLEPILKGFVEHDIALDQCMFCTDDKHLEDIEKEGHIDFCVRKAIALGVPAATAYKMASYNAARAYNLHDLGAVGAGYLADLLIIDDLDQVSVELVIKNGEIIDFDQLNSQNIAPVSDADLLNSVKLPKIKQENLELKADNTPVKVINLVAQSILTRGSEEILPSVDGKFEANRDFNKACVIERHGHSGGIGVSTIKGYNIENGAIATSVSHDAHNITAVGDNDADILLAVKELDRIQGGYVIASKGEIVAALPLELAGIISIQSGKTVQAQLNKMVAHARALGVPESIDPFMTLSFIALTVIPELRLTDNGLYDVNLGQFV